MENKFLLELELKYGLAEGEASKLADVLYQCGLRDTTSEKFQEAALFVCDNGLVNLPEEELVEELKLNGFSAN